MEEDEDQTPFFPSSNVHQNVPNNTTLYSDNNCTNEVEISGADTIHGMDADKDYYGFITENGGTETCKKLRKETLDTPPLYTSCGWLPFGWGKTKTEEKFSICYTLSDEKKLCYDNVSNMNDFTGCRTYTSGRTDMGGTVRFDCGGRTTEYTEPVAFYSDSSCTTLISEFSKQQGYDALHALETGKEYYLKSRQFGTSNIYTCQKTTKRDETPLYQSCGWLPFEWSKKEADDKLYSMCTTDLTSKKQLCLNNVRNFGHFHGCSLMNINMEGEIDCQNPKA